VHIKKALRKIRRSIYDVQLHIQMDTLAEVIVCNTLARDAWPITELRMTKHFLSKQCDAVRKSGCGTMAYPAESLAGFTLPCWIGYYQIPVRLNGRGNLFSCHKRLQV
jgi:hypothetical protein